MEFCIYISRGIFTAAVKRHSRFLEHKYIAVLRFAAYTNLHAIHRHQIYPLDLMPMHQGIGSRAPPI